MQALRHTLPGEYPHLALWHPYIGHKRRFSATFHIVGGNGYGTVCDVVGQGEGQVFVERECDITFFHDGREIGSLTHLSGQVHDGCRPVVGGESELMFIGAGCCGIQVDGNVLSLSSLNILGGIEHLCIVTALCANEVCLIVTDVSEFDDGAYRSANRYGRT